MNPQQAYDAWASSYDSDRNLTRDLDAQVTRQMLAGLPAARVLELGCGTGKNTAFLTGMAQEMLALDFSGGMLAQARARLPQARFARADLTQPWPCPAAHFDLIVGNLVLEHIADLGFIFGQAARALKPGGHCFVCELHPFRQYQGKKAVFEHSAGSAEIDAFTHHISEFIDAAQANGLALRHFGEWWHGEDIDKPPRLASFLFERG